MAQGFVGCFPPWYELGPRRLTIGPSVPQPTSLADLDDLEDLPDRGAPPGCRSQLGGRPKRVQSREYPSCPGCGQPMPFLGQIDLGDPPWRSEGVYYAFVDSGCGLACTWYQQT